MEYNWLIVLFKEVHLINYNFCNESNPSFILLFIHLHKCVEHQQRQLSAPVFDFNVSEGPDDCQRTDQC